MSSIDKNNEGNERWQYHDEWTDEPGMLDRRRFLKIMGASMALAGMTGCRFPVEKIVPFAGRPMGMKPGEPMQYATAMDFAGTGSGLLAVSYDGRPIKIDGNPMDPLGGGSSTAFQQASILELYDPDRSQFVTIKRQGRREAATWADFHAFALPAFAALGKGGGAGLRVLSEASSSPSLADMRARFLKAFPRASWHEYEPVSRDNELEGAKLVYGEPLQTHMRLGLASTIVCVDADILMRHPASLQLARDFAGGRTADRGTMNRLYVVESGCTITGAAADHRIAVPAGDALRFLLSLAAELFIKRNIPIPAPYQSAAESLRSFRADAFPASFMRSVADDLEAKRGESVIVCGPRQPAVAHALAHVLNEALGNSGKTVLTGSLPGDALKRNSHVNSLRALTVDMRGGKVKTLLIIGGNPVYNAPADLEFGKCLRSVTTSIHLNIYANETSDSCGWHLPRAHYLEAWGDARTHDGAIVTAQPIIAPLYDGKSDIELLSSLMDNPPLSGQDIVQRTAGLTKDDKAWHKVIHDGYQPQERAREPNNSKPELIPGEWMSDIISSAANTRKAGGLELVFSPDYSVYDGRFANNGWLQELPDPVTKITWDNAALISPATAGVMKLSRGDVVRITNRGRSVEVPVYVLEDHADNSVTLFLGYGRTKCGRVGDGVGTNVYPIRTSDAMDIAAGARMEKTGRAYDLATTQERFDIKSIGEESTRERTHALVRQADLEEYRKNPDFAKSIEPHPPLTSLWKERGYEGHKWGMTIDLSKCNGCSVCVAACQAENNVPIVGKDQVLRGREMHWVRIDRYFTNGERVVFQPIPCMQCENAPCEQVCPVAATQHTTEGLNDMVYNRCIGMRYCSQNCPYKVRRFNYFNNHKNITDVEKMVYNPDVTVRMRGVMEKCTYCVQRIQEAKIQAKAERRPLTDGEITPACAQACPAKAIVFGDLNLPGSEVGKQYNSARSYALLEELNTKPRTVYLAKLRNPKS